MQDQMFILFILTKAMLINSYPSFPSRHGPIPVPMLEVPKMSMGAACFTSLIAIAVVGWFL